MAQSESLVRVLRGGIEESFHTGTLALVENGVLKLSRGDPERVVFYRSASKPLQAIELVRCGAADAFGLTDAELAIASGSHSAEPRHIAAARSILAKSGVPESALRCGGHRSVSSDIAFAQRRDGVPMTPILSNCSGKHAGMLAAAKHRGDALEGYLELTHPVQQAILDHVAAFADLPRDRVLAGVDGCGAPALALSLVAMARSIANLGAPDSLPAPLAAAARRIGSAMRTHPEMVAGDERFDTDLMLAAKGRVIAKSGAEGVHVTAIPDRRSALAVKVDDGADRGYRAVVIEVLRRLAILADADADELRARHATTVMKNMAGRPVGRLELTF